jgi:hypothetical protein
MSQLETSFEETFVEEQEEDNSKPRYPQPYSLVYVRKFYPKNSALAGREIERIHGRLKYEARHKK